MRKLFLLLIIFCLLPAAVFAHPHMFIDMKTAPVFSEAGFEGVRITWLFDMVFTGSVLMDNSIGWKESFNDSEIEIIKSTSFANLVNYNFYTYFNNDGHFSRPDSFDEFRAFMMDNRLGYEFFLPYTEDRKNASVIRIAIYDDTFFCDIAYDEDKPVTIIAPASVSKEWSLSEKKNAPIYYDNTAQRVAREGAEYNGQAFPVELVVENGGE